MSFAYLVLYEGRPDDPPAFLDYYLRRHVPLLWEFPEIRDVEVDVGRDGGDIFMITRLHFDTIDELRAAITSPERWRAREDMTNFPPFNGTVRRQIVEVVEGELDAPEGMGAG